MGWFGLGCRDCCPTAKLFVPLVCHGVGGAYNSNNVINMNALYPPDGTGAVAPDTYWLVNPPGRLRLPSEPIGTAWTVPSSCGIEGFIGINNRVTGYVQPYGFLDTGTEWNHRKQFIRYGFRLDQETPADMTWFELCAGHATFDPERILVRGKLIWNFSIEGTYQNPQPGDYDFRAEPAFKFDKPDEIAARAALSGTFGTPMATYSTSLSFTPTQPQWPVLTNQRVQDVGSFDFEFDFTSDLQANSIRDVCLYFGMNIEPKLPVKTWAINPPGWWDEGHYVGSHGLVNNFQLVAVKGLQEQVLQISQ